MGLPAVFGYSGYYSNQGGGPPVSTEGTKRTYSAGIIGFAPFATAPTDIAQLIGSATTTVRVTRIHIWMTDTSAVQTILPIQLVKRSTATTLGSATATPAAIAPHDSADAAATAVFNTFTVANPTPLGSLVGSVIRAGLLASWLATLTATDFPPGQAILWDFTTNMEKAPVLRGVAQQLALNLNGATIVGTQSMDIAITWTEE